ncbi:hypothetical protein FHG87_009097 [Trinorchestia longiramus]|nr:hypothetical protein FHG87_009097 [Trinorchestia longiramus]
MVSRTLLLLSASLFTAVILRLTNASPLSRNVALGPDYEDPELTLLAINHLLHSGVLDQPNKRGLDLGLGRGFSGSQAAKHLMGLSAASYAGGPGKRKRQSAADYLRQDESMVLRHPDHLLD